MGKTMRFSVSIDGELLKRFEEVIKEKKYGNRSEAIRHLMRNFIIESEWEHMKGEVMGALTLLYDHNARDITERLVEIQHERHANVISAMHIHLDEHYCMEMIVIRGAPKEVTETSDKLISCKGVKHGKLVMSSVGRRIV